MKFSQINATTTNGTETVYALGLDGNLYAYERNARVWVHIDFPSGHAKVCTESVPAPQYQGNVKLAPPAETI